MGYLTPADAWVPDDWQGHRNRNPSSPEPGTDYATAYGTNLRIADNGTVSVIDWSNGGGEGRRLSVDLDDGRRVSYLHLSRISAYIGQRVGRGQLDVIWSGASGNGNDYYYGAHVHVSLWERPGMAYRDTIDFQLYVGPDSESEDDEMNADQARQLGEIHQALYTTPEQPGGWNGINKVLSEVQTTGGEVHQAIYTTPNEPGGWNGIALQLGEVHEATVKPEADPASRTLRIWLTVLAITAAIADVGIISIAVAIWQR